MADNTEFDYDLGLKDETDIREPKLYKVIIHNDDYTTMDFVVEVIRDVFHKPAAEATKIMLEVHQKGAGVAGIYTFDIAQTKIAVAKELAKSKEFPLMLTCEEA